MHTYIQTYLWYFEKTVMEVMERMAGFSRRDRIELKIRRSGVIYNTLTCVYL